jgi:SAM-dependent methyltransferase
MSSWQTHIRIWEANGGREQSRSFAKAFLDHFHPENPDFSLLDVGCGKGDGTELIAAFFPKAQVYGADPYGTVGVISTFVEKYLRAGITEINGFYEYILCSNVLEHTRDYWFYTRILLEHCRTLFILVPYREKILKRRQGEGFTVEHITSFDETSFDFLLQEYQVNCKIIPIPKASLWNRWQFVKNGIWNIKRLLKSQAAVSVCEYILYEIRGASA